MIGYFTTMQGNVPVVKSKKVLSCHVFLLGVYERIYQTATKSRATYAY